MTHLQKAVVGVAVVGILLLVLDRFFGLKHDAREPPLVPQRIPYFGHLIGLISRGTNYYAETTYVSHLSIA
jgi:hypothetical protein